MILPAREQQVVREEAHVLEHGQSEAAAAAVARRSEVDPQQRSHPESQWSGEPEAHAAAAGM